MRHVVIGTAGHIDHGKTTLIKALTGRCTDNLPEELRRGISINLGFTYFDLPGGKRAGIIDVPGHERFIKNMLAGAAGIDIALLIIAANEGVKPQTIEHTDILEFLNIKERLIVLTKCGLADELMMELVIDDIRDKMKGTSFESADIIPVDSISGYNLEALIKKIDALAENCAGRNEAAPARLNVDRVFTMKGFGTIVTGTLSEGVIKANDELMLYPDKKAARIRNIQVHGRNTEIARAGQRTSLNIANLRPDEIQRGDVLAVRNSIEETMLLDVKITMVAHTDKELKFWSRLRIYIGAKEFIARLVPLDTNIVRQGESAFCQLRLEEKAAVKKNDKFVIRTYSPMETVGGGEILDPCPKKHGKSPEVIQSLLAKSSGDLIDAAESFIKDSENYLTAQDVANHISKDLESTMAALNELAAKKTVVALGDFYFHMDLLDSYMRLITGELEKQHKKNPLKTGIQKDEIKTRLKLGIKGREYDMLLELMENEGLIKKVTANSIALSGFLVEYSSGQLKMKNDILHNLLEGGFAPPGIDELTKGGKQCLVVLDSMIPEDVVRLDANIVIHRKYYDEALSKLAQIIDDKNEITLAEFRDAINSTRKYAMAILDDFDKKSITKREGDKRAAGINYRKMFL